MKDKLILLASDRMGTGDDALGAALLENFLTVVKSRPQSLPFAVFCVNRGVLTLTDRSLCNVHLTELEAAGVQVLACMTCVDYYEIGDQLRAGQLSSMGAFVDLSGRYEVVTIG